MNKRIIFAFVFAILLIGIVSAEFTFDNSISYSKGEMKATITNFFGLGDKIGSVELKSHNSPTEVRGVMQGKDRVVMWYEFSDWKDVYKNGFGEVEFTNMKTGEKIEKDYHFAKLVVEEKEADSYYEECTDKKNWNGTIVKDCVNVKNGTHIEKKERWERVESKDIPKEKITIALITDVDKGDYIDGVWTIAGKKIKEHASWDSAFDSILIGYYGFDEGAGTITNESIYGRGNLTLVNGLGWSSGADCIAGNCLGPFDEANDLAVANWTVESSPISKSWKDMGNNWTICTGWNITSLVGEQHIISTENLSTSKGNAILQVGGIVYFENNGTASVQTTNVVLTQNHWNWICVAYNGTGFENGLSIWVNGTEQDISASVDASNAIGNGDGGNVTIGGTDSNGIIYSIKGKVDLNYVFNQSLSSTQHSDLYNGGDILIYEKPSFDVVTTLDAPADASNFNYHEIFTNGTSVAIVGNIQNISLYIDNALNYTYDAGAVGTEANLTINRSMDDGTYVLKFVSCNDQTPTYCANSSKSTIYIETISPILNSSSNGTSFDYHVSGNNLTINWSVSDPNLANCSIDYYGATFLIPCSDNNISLNITDGNYRSLNITANDTYGNEVSFNVSWRYKIFQHLINYNFSTYESSLENISINITFDDSAYTSIIGNLSYNGTNYYSGLGLTENTLFSKSIYAPSVTGDSNATFNFIFKLTNASGSIFLNSSYYNQTIHPIDIEVNTTCTAGLYNPICFDFKDEQNLSNIYTAVVNYNFAFGISNSTNKVKNGTLTTDHICLCLNSTIYNNYTIGRGEIEYTSTSYTDRRYYLFDNQRLANNTIINQSLYMLLNSEATSFLFDFEDTSLTPIISKFASLMRWYPNLNEYKVVEMGKTDDKGETIMRVKAEDTDYRVGLYHQNGTLIKLLNPVRFACVTSPCTYSSLIQDSTSDYTSFFGVQTDLDYNETTELWTYTWNDPSQNTGSMRLVVERLRGDGSYTICDTSASGFTGILTCDSSGYSGLLEARAYRTASPAVPITSKQVNTGTFVMAGALGLVISLIIFLVLVLIGIWSPVASIILGVVGLIPAYFFGTITLPILIGVGVLGGIVIHFMKRTG